MNSGPKRKRQQKIRGCQALFLENSHARADVASSARGGGGSGIPSAINVTASMRGGGGKGIPSASRDSDASRGGGGKGIPSANCVCVAPGTAGLLLTELLARTTMEPISTMKLDARVNCVKRMDGTSWLHPAFSTAAFEFGGENVPLAEQAAGIYG